MRLALAVAVALRIPTFRYPLVSDDEAIYDAMAQVIVRGGTMYQQAVDHKPPGLAYTYSAVRALVEHVGGSFGAVMTGVHLVGVLAVVATCVLLHAIARETLHPRLAGVPPLLYAFASAASVAPDSLAVNGELLMNVPTAAAVWFALRASPAELGVATRFARNFAAGACCGVAALYKYQAALVGLSFFFLLPDPRSDGRAFARSLFAQGTALALGLLTPALAVVAFFWRRGALDEAVRWGIEFNAHYLREGPDLRAAAARLSMQLLGVVLPSVLVYGAGLYALFMLLSPQGRAHVRRVGIARGRALLVVWAFESLYCVTLGRRFFGHYFLQPDLPLAVLAAGPVATLWLRRPRLVAVAMGLPALLFFTLAAVPEESARFVYAADPDYWAIGRAVARRTKPSETIWVWGNVPQVYFAAERRPGVRFTFCNYLTGLSPGSRSELDPTYDSRQNAVPGAWDMVVRDLDTNRPAVIIDTAAGGMKSYGKFPISSFPVLATYLAAHYRADGVVEGAVLYRRTDAPGSS